jgi:hypothetical protein
MWDIKKASKTRAREAFLITLSLLWPGESHHAGKDVVHCRWNYSANNVGCCSTDFFFVLKRKSIE